MHSRRIVEDGSFTHGLSHFETSFRVPDKREVRVHRSSASRAGWSATGMSPLLGGTALKRRFRRCAATVSYFSLQISAKPDNLGVPLEKPHFFPQYKRVAEIVRRRIMQGSYSLKAFPSERALAEELGVNYMTVRRGMQILEKENLLSRLENGRMRVKRIQQGKKNHLIFGFLTPTFSSGTVESWRMAIEKVAADLACSVRPILYMHWDDPILIDALEGFDGIFLDPIPQAVPDRIAERLRKQEHPVVVVDQDQSALGAPSIQLFPPVFVQKLLDHFESLGHKRIGCFNTQTSCQEVEDRINQWRYWMSAHGFSGRLVNEFVAPHGDPVERAYTAMSRILKEGKVTETAWIFITTPAAVGAMRAMLDHNYQPGKDFALGSVNGDGLASMLNPPLTSLEPPDPVPFISVCLAWMMKGGRNWQGPLLMRPSDVPLMIRESSQPGAGRGTGQQPFAPESMR